MEAPPTLRHRPAGDRGVEDLDGVGGGELNAPLPQELGNLEGAAGVGAGEKVGLRLQNVVDLSLADLVGGLGLDQVVDSGAVAALVAVWDLDELQARDPG